MTDASTFFPGQLFQNPDGTFTLNITGQVQSKGLSIREAAVSAFAAGDAMAWTDTGAPDGTVHEWIQGSNNGSTRLLRLLSQTDGAHSVTLDLQLDFSTGHAQLVLSATGTAGASQYVIARDDGVSAFLRLATPDKRITAFGRATLTWAGGTPTASIVVNHNLGVAPVAITFGSGVMSDGQGAAAVIGRNPGLDTSSQFTASARISGNYYNPAAGTTCQFDWTAIG